jgi:hypothetical protein
MYVHKHQRHVMPLEEAESSFTASGFTNKHEPTSGRDDLGSSQPEGREVIHHQHRDF